METGGRRRLKLKKINNFTIHRDEANQDNHHKYQTSIGDAAKYTCRDIEKGLRYIAHNNHCGSAFIHAQ